MQRRDFLAVLGALALAGCERPRSAAGGGGYMVTLLDLKTGREIGKKSTGPLPVLRDYYSRPLPAFGFISSSPPGYLIEADSAKVHHFETDPHAVVWHQKDACIAYNNEATQLVDLPQAKVVWSNTDHVATGTRIVSAGVVLVPHRGGVAGLDLNTGKTLWNETSLGNPGFMLAHRGQAIVSPYHQNRIEFRDLKTGRLGQSIQLSQSGAIPSQGVLAGDTLVIGCPRVGIFAYRDQKLVWQIKLQPAEYYPSFPGADSSLVLFSADGSEVRAVEAGTGKPLWKGPVTQGDGCVLAGGVLVNRDFPRQGQSDVELSARDARTGKVLWAMKVAPDQPLSADDKRVALFSRT